MLYFRSSICPQWSILNQNGTENILLNFRLLNFRYFEIFHDFKKSPSTFLIKKISHSNVSESPLILYNYYMDFVQRPSYKMHKINKTNQIQICSGKSNTKIVWSFQIILVHKISKYVREFSCYRHFKKWIFFR